MGITGAFILPHAPILLSEIGGGKEARVQKTIDSCRQVAREISRLKPEVIILTSPHALCYADYFSISSGKGAWGNFGTFGARDVTVQVHYDEELASQIEGLAMEQGIPAGSLGEKEKDLDHGTMVPLKFVNEFYSDYKVVRIGLSGLSNLEHYRLGKCIAEAATVQGKNVVFLASGDLSHRVRDEGPYGFAEEGVEFDSLITKAMAEGDFYRFLTMDPTLCEKAEECGLRSFIIMAGALDGKKVRSFFLSYEGSFGVGYGVAHYEIIGEEDNRKFDVMFEKHTAEQIRKHRKKESAPVKLAREALEHYITTGRTMKRPENLPAELRNNRAGVFVSLKKYGQLRGCIGTIGPTTECIGDEILRNAVCAGVEDPRFDPVEKEELKDIIYSVDVLGEAEKIQSMEELDVKRYGVIVTSGGKRGLLLPNLEGIDTPEEQVRIARAKATIDEREPAELERFEVMRFQ